MKVRGFKLFLIVVSVWAIAGCESHTQEGALIGGIGGAAVGGAIGSKSHSRAGEGALIGGAAGALGGAAIGGQMDKNEKEAEEARRAEEERRIEQERRTNDSNDDSSNNNSSGGYWDKK